MQRGPETLQPKLSAGGSTVRSFCALFLPKYLNIMQLLVAYLYKVLYHIAGLFVRLGVLRVL